MNALNSTYLKMSAVRSRIYYIYFFNTCLLEMREQLERKIKLFLGISPGTIVY